MNAYFERAQSAYPIGYLRNTQSESVEYRVTDMRTLEALDAPSIPLNKAVQVAHTLNEQIRSKQTESNHASLSAAAQLLIAPLL